MISGITFSILHAPSYISYDISRGNYKKFQSKFFLPNSCGNVASVKVIFLADGKEIYNPSVLRAGNSQNIQISFDIPSNTNNLVIRVTDAGDGTRL